MVPRQKRIVAVVGKTTTVCIVAKHGDCDSCPPSQLHPSEVKVSRIRKVAAARQSW